MSNKITLELTPAELAIITTLLNQSKNSTKTMLDGKVCLTPVESVIYNKGTHNVWDTLTQVCSINGINWQEGTYTPPRPTTIRLF